jgi:hypothetical protein
MSPVFKFATVFALAILGMTFAPRHACHLSSPLLFALVVAVSLVVVPFVASRSKKSWVTWTLGAAAPFIGFAALFFYVEVLHWQHFPKLLLHDGTPNKPAAPNAGIASRLTIDHHWPGVGEPERYA